MYCVIASFASSKQPYHMGLRLRAFYLRFLAHGRGYKPPLYWAYGPAPFRYRTYFIEVPIKVFSILSEMTLEIKAGMQVFSWFP